MFIVHYLPLFVPFNAAIWKFLITWITLRWWLSQLSKLTVCRGPRPVMVGAPLTVGPPPPPPMFGSGGENLLFGLQVKGTVDTCRKVLLKALQFSTGPFPGWGAFSTSSCCGLTSFLSFGEAWTRTSDGRITPKHYTIPWRIYCPTTTSPAEILEARLFT